MDSEVDVNSSETVETDNLSSNKLEENNVTSNDLVKKVDQKEENYDADELETTKQPKVVSEVPITIGIVDSKKDELKRQQIGRYVTLAVCFLIFLALVLAFFSRKPVNKSINKIDE